MGKIKMAQKGANIFLKIGVDLLRNNAFYDILVKKYKLGEKFNGRYNERNKAI